MYEIPECCVQLNSMVYTPAGTRWNVRDKGTLTMGVKAASLVLSKNLSMGLFECATTFADMFKCYLHNDQL
jgi:hypothetical protein